MVQNESLGKHLIQKLGYIHDETVYLYNEPQFFKELLINGRIIISRTLPSK